MTALFYGFAFISLSIVLVTNVAVSEPGQLTARLPRRVGLPLLKRYRLLVSVSLVAFVVALAAGGLGLNLSPVILIAYAVFFAMTFIMTFVVMETVIFPAQQRNAEYVPISEVSGLDDNEDVFVVALNGDARA